VSTERVKTDPPGGERLPFFIIYLSELMEPQTFSVLGGIGSLYGHGEFGLATIILAFSVLFPVIKNVTLLVLSANDQSPKPGEGLNRLKAAALWFLTTFGSWSMLDVFVVAVIVVSFKGFPGGTRIVRHWGLFCFAASVLCTMTAAALIKPGSHTPLSTPTAGGSQ
jgi:paraquat-inducible protein A